MFRLLTEQYNSISKSLTFTFYWYIISCRHVRAIRHCDVWLCVLCQCGNNCTFHLSRHTQHVILYFVNCIDNIRRPPYKNCVQLFVLFNCWILTVTYKSQQDSCFECKNYWLEQTATVFRVLYKSIAVFILIKIEIIISWEIFSISGGGYATIAYQHSV